MKNKIPSAKEILSKKILRFPEDQGMSDQNIQKNVVSAMIEFTNLHVNAALASASRKAKAEMKNMRASKLDKFLLQQPVRPVVNKGSILNSYPLKEIK